ncbi:MAG TPA: glucosamine-6-phosphate deaminase [Candidatus Sumerlaeota bacterium]|nr:glucosamine-6-phosphate deaminase [Candidatus Sumerlaeota bacterium]
MPAKNKTGAGAKTAGSELDAWNKYLLTPVEKTALDKSGFDLMYPPDEKIPSIIVEHFPALGRLTAIRFLEWVLENPEGAICLPTGKTPEYFIKFTLHYLENWTRKKVREELETMGLATSRKPSLQGLRFVQIDEFFPIDTRQHNSFFYYVNKFYIKGFGLDPARALFINPNEIGIPPAQEVADIFPGNMVDLSLRVRKPKSLVEKRQQSVLFAVDQFCTEYERKIRAMGGIGFFLGGIGPDGHIAFNVRGADFYSSTRLCRANYETKAAAATDLGGIEVARNKHVITIGLETITFNPGTVAIIIAAGEAKAGIVAKTIHSDLHNKRPGSALQALPHSRFYLTRGAAKELKRRCLVTFERKDQPSDEDVRRIVMDISLCRAKPIRELNQKDFENEPFGALLLKKSARNIGDIKSSVEEAILSFIQKGNSPASDKTFLHTAPHHDDIILAYLPWFTNLVRDPSTDHYFAYMTSGFNAVTNTYMLGITEDLLNSLSAGEFDALLDSGYFEPGNEKTRRLDTAIFLDGAARHHPEKMQEGVARRYLRNMIEVYEDDNITNIRQRLAELVNYFRTQYPGKKDINLVQQLKGRCREFESDLKWAYYGFTGDHVRHLRLGFYKGDVFTEQPTLDRDVPPIMKLLREINPDYVTVAFDPEGSGPDTHYKVLQAVSQALRVHEKESGRSDIRVLGYRNVWFKFHPSESNLYVPTTLTHLNDMEAAFDTCFTTQRAASFPSHEYDGPFSRLARKIQCKQFEQVKTFLGEDFFVDNNNHIMRAARGMVYLRDMNLREFYSASEELKHIAEEH